MQTNKTPILLQQAIQQVKNGQKRAAAHNLALVLRVDPEQVEAWLWLSACVDSHEKQVDCLRQALRIDPHHRGARKGLEMLMTQVTPQALPVTGAPDAALSSPDGLSAGDLRADPRPALFPEMEDAEPLYEAHPEAPVEVTRRSRWSLWRLLGLVGLLLVAAAGGIFGLTQVSRSGGGSLPFGGPAGWFVPAEEQIRSGADLAGAIRDAPQGGVISLPAGTYNLTETLEITRAVQLRGEGMNATRIHSSAAGAAVHIHAVGSVQLHELEILHTGALPANGVEIDSGQLIASGIRVGGARLDGQSETGGRGLLIRDQAGADVSASEMLDNARAGIEIRGPGSVVIRQNAVHDNGQYGILVGGSANPRLQENDLTRNGEAGISLTEGARGDARKNRLEQNGIAGIRVEGQAVSLIYENTSLGNVAYGIEVRGQAAPVVIGNTVQRNGKTGLAYFDRAAGAAESNDCYENELHGISVNQNASPFLKQNRCNQNRQVGIDYWGDAGGTAANNECSRNGLQGIAVHENALPVLQNNACTGNNDSGIVFWDDAAGIASNNNCSDNRLNGISVHNQARPLLLKNICRQNLLNGIVFFDQAAGEARENECANNGTDRILLPAGTQVSLKGNRCGGSE